jgi:hypothetical protein
MAEAKRDQNRVPTLIGVSSVDGVTPVTVYADPVTHRLYVSAVSGTLGELSDVNIATPLQGDIIYRNGSDEWVALNAGVNGQFLKTQGASANPTWDAPTAGAAGSDTQVQFNDGGSALGGEAGFTYNKTTDSATLVGAIKAASADLIDTNASHRLRVVAGSDLTADRILTVTTGDSARTLTMTNDASIAGTNTGDQTITLSGAVTGTGTGAITTTMNSALDSLTDVAITTPLTNQVVSYNGSTWVNQLDQAHKPFLGISSRGALSFDNSTHILTIAATTNTYWYNGTVFTTASAITCDIDSFVTLTDNTLYWITFNDSTGVLSAGTTINLRTQVPVCTVFWNGSAGAISNESHNATRDVDWHINAHLTIGTRYYTGLVLTNPTTANDALLQIEAGTIYDEDIAVSITQQTTSRIFYMTSASFFTYADSALPYAGTSGQPQYLDTDTYTLTNVSASNYACMWVYATPDTARNIYIIPTHAADSHNTIAAARAEATPNLNGMNLNPEMKLIYRFIYKGDGQFQESADFRTSSSLPSGGTTAIGASAVTFVPAGGIASTNVQSAIEELDTEKAPLASPTFTGTVTLPVGLTGVLRADTGVVSTDSDVTDLVTDAVADGSTKGKATFVANDFTSSSGNIGLDYANGQKASDTQAGFLTEIATAAETTTGTDAARAVSPDGLAGSDYGKRVVGILVVDPATNTATGDGKAFFRVPSVMNGWNLVGVNATVYTAGTTNTTTVQIRNITQTADMLSTAMTIDSGEVDTSTAATPPVIDTNNDDVATGDRIAIDVDAISTTPAKGLYCELIFQLP